MQLTGAPQRLKAPQVLSTCHCHVHDSKAYNFSTGGGIEVFNSLDIFHRNMKSWDGQSNQAHRRSLLAGGRTVR